MKVKNRQDPSSVCYPSGNSFGILKSGWKAADNGATSSAFSEKILSGLYSNYLLKIRTTQSLRSFLMASSTISVLTAVTRVRQRSYLEGRKVCFNLEFAGSVSRSDGAIVSGFG